MVREGRPRRRQDTATAAEPLPRLELVVLARLATRGPATGQAVAATIGELVAPAESAARTRELAGASLARLRTRGLVAPGRHVLTAAGRQALAQAFGLDRAPTWSAVRDRHLPALALGLAPGSAEARRGLGSLDGIQAALVAERLGCPRPDSVAALGDAMLAEALGLASGPVTLDRLRAHVLARRLGIEPRGELAALAARVAAAAVRAPRSDRPTLARALARRWAAAPEAATAAPAALQPDGASSAAADTRRRAAIRAGLERVGPEGRYGPDKVFIAAIWRVAANDPELCDLTLAELKGWLVHANRNGWLSLARADLVGAMAAAEVATSEIIDQGSTFHFVLDPSADGAGGG